MGANTYSYTDTYPHANSYSYSYPHADADPYSTSILHHIAIDNIGPSYDFDNAPFDHFDSNYQFISIIINFISTDYHIFNHHDSSLSD